MYQNGHKYAQIAIKYPMAMTCTRILSQGLPKLTIWAWKYTHLATLERYSWRSIDPDFTFVSTSRVARWFVFKPKFPNFGIFLRALDWKNGYVLWPFGIFYRHLGYFMTIWYILCSFGTFFPVSWNNKNLAILSTCYVIEDQAEMFCWKSSFWQARLPMKAVQWRKSKKKHEWAFSFLTTGERENQAESSQEHRNLRSRTSMLAQVLQIFFGKEHLVKNWMISTLDKVIYYQGTIFQRSTKPLFTSQNRVKKIIPF
jgi:hypothetical protein